MATLIAGQMFAGMKLIRLLGEGFWSQVWMAEHTALGKYRAVKVMKPVLAAKPNFVTRFYREARAMALIEHQNVVKVLDVGDFDGQPYLVMEYHESTDLHRLYYEVGIDEIRVLEIIADVLRALAVVHERGIIHRDVKPENVLVGKDGVTRLTDFGIAQVMEGDTRMTQAQDVMGTLRYMAPEQKGGLLQVLIESDLYAIGMMLFELLGGEIPTDPRFTLDMFVAEIRVPKLASFAPIVRQLLERALQYAPENRYRSAEEMLGAVLAVRRQLIKEQKKGVAPAEPTAVMPVVETVAQPIAVFNTVDEAPGDGEGNSAPSTGQTGVPEADYEPDPFADLPEPVKRRNLARYGLGAITVLSLVVVMFFVWPSADVVITQNVTPPPEAPKSEEPPSVKVVVEPVPEILPEQPKAPVTQLKVVPPVKPPKLEVAPVKPPSPVQVKMIDPPRPRVELQHQPITSLATATLVFKAQAPVGSKLMMQFRVPGNPWQEAVSLKEAPAGSFETTLSSADFIDTGLDYFLEAKFPDGQSRKTGTFKVR